MTLFLPQEPGTVLLVGAGPGDLGLLTVTGLRALERADVIVADRLGARSVIDQLETERGAALDAQIIDVGKQPGHHPVPQSKINDILVEQAKRGHRVVRLKGGDPFVLGRGGEEVIACRAAGVDVRVVPGVTSANSVPAVAGIPLTHRGVATAYTVVTGHDQLSEIGGGRDHTVVVLMGVGTLINSAMVLARSGRSDDCPVAIVEDGFGENQRVTIGTLGDIAFRAARRGVRSPAVIVAGDVVALSPYAAGKQKNLEGFVFPATYEFRPKDSAQTIVKKMVERMNEEFTPGNVAKAKALGLDVRDWVTLASMVQAEAANNEEMPVIAGVFLNRLRDGIPLGSDPTVAYGLGKDLPELDRSAGDFKVDPHYSTYTRQGLPAGPINNPGEAALLSIVNPQRKMADGRDALYFLHAGGKIYVNHTYAEHLRDNDRYR